jgi:hypothetical protein
VAHYPDILFMMDQKSDWTASLGQAFINQQQDVMDAIQRLRADAESEGNLVSTPEQQVINDGGYISIVPAEQEVIFVPQYDPQVVYVKRYPAYGFITFGIGLRIGAWLDRDCDWQGRRVFYHGWQGEGWISRARPYISDRSNIYINDRYSVVNVNRRVIQHNTVNFRGDLRRNVQSRPKPAPQQTTRPGAMQPGGGSGSRREADRPVTTVTRPVERPDNGALYRGREIQGPQPAARSGYGGYGSGKDATTYRERGQSSRGNMGQFNRQQQIPAQRQRPAPAQTPAAAQGPRPAPGSPTAQPTPRQSVPAPSVTQPAPRHSAPASPATQPAPRQPAPADRGGGQEQRHR